MNFRTQLHIAAGKRRAKRGGVIPPPIGTWERVGWDEWHSQLEWDRRLREERQSEAHITTGYFTPIRTATARARATGHFAVSSFRRIALAVTGFASLYVAGRFVLHWI